MTDIRSNSQKRNVLPAVSIKNYEIIVDKSLGFNVKLNWEYQNNNVVLFKVYKKKLQKSLLDKDFVIGQAALERTTGNQTRTSVNTVLYNKNFYVQNSKVKIENTSINHTQIETNLADGAYKEIGIVKYSNNNGRYTFFDKDTRFGESVIYYITAISRNLKETAPELLRINIQELSTPPFPQNLSILEKDAGLLLTFGNKKSQNITSYVLYKKSNQERDFSFLAEVKNDNDTIFFYDTEVLPKKVYNYRVYSKDMFGNISTTSAEKTGVFNYNILTDIFLKPKFYVDRQDDFLKIKIVNQYPNDIIGARIERKDLWRFEKSYSIKEYNNIPWDNIFYFNDNVIEFIDKTTQKDREYSYKITCFGKNHFPKTYTFSPAIKVGETYKEEEDFIFDYVAPSITLIDSTVINNKQNPSFIKFKFLIDGDWSYLNCKINNEKTIKIDSLHDEVFIPIEDDRKNSVIFELYDGFKNKVQEYPEIKINT